MVRLRLEGRSKAEVHHQAQWLSQKLLGENKPDVAILGPSEPFIERLKGVYRWDILLKARNPSNLHALTAVAKSLSKEKRWPLLVDVDPNGLG